MEIEGKVIIDLGQTEGVSKAGNAWKKHEWVIETFGRYPRQVKLHFFGDRADSNVLQPGKCYNITVEVESRQFNSRWYTDVAGLSSREIHDPSAAPEFSAAPAAVYSTPAAAPQAPFDPMADQTDDLPF